MIISVLAFASVLFLISLHFFNKRARKDEAQRQENIRAAIRDTPMFDINFTQESPITERRSPLRAYLRRDSPQVDGKEDAR